MAEKINVIWKTYHPNNTINRGYWDQGILEDLFKDGDFEHHNDFNWTKHPWYEGAIVIINGRTHVNEIAKINGDLGKLRWVLFIETGDEEALFNLDELKHPIMKKWVQLPRMNKHNDVYKLVNGYRPETAEILKEIGNQERSIDVYFAGQVNHPRRSQCVEALKNIPLGRYRNIVISETERFGEEKIPYVAYLENMAKSKIVLCPSGIESPDTFRLYEALEAGCVPVVDAFATNNQDWGFWQYLFGENPPFPIISYWDKLPELLPEIMKDYPELANKCSSWWQLKKRSIKYKLLDDVRELSR